MASAAENPRSGSGGRFDAGLAQVELVERLSGRRVVAFMSDHDTEQDIAAEIFVLAPEADDAAGEAVEEVGSARNFVESV